MCWRGGGLHSHQTAATEVSNATDSLPEPVFPICKVGKLWDMGLTPVISWEPYGVHNNHVVICQGLRGGMEVTVQASV